MASHLKTVMFIADQSGLGARLTYKRMFGEYALYLDAKVVAFVCDDKLFLKPTDAGRALLGSPTEAPAYPGSKNYFLLQEELESPSLLRAALEVTEAAVPLPKPKAKAKAKPRAPASKKAPRKRSPS